MKFNQVRKLLILIFLAKVSFSQNVTITPDGITPDSRYPELSYNQIKAISSPLPGNLAYDTTFNCLRVYNGTKWLCSWQNPNALEVSSKPFAVSNGDSFQVGRAITTDLLGNVYVTGYFGGTADFDGNIVSSNGFMDIFLAKYNSTGDLQWIQKAGGFSANQPSEIEVDTEGNVYITGYISEWADFDGVIKTGDSDVSNFFIAKYNTEGEIQWVKSGVSQKNSSGYKLLIDSSNNIYISGMFSGTIIFDSFSLSTEESKGVFLMKLDKDGDLLWVHQFDGDFTQSYISFDTDSEGILYVSGSFKNSIKFDGIAGEIMISTSENSSLFYGKFDPMTSKWLWVKSLVGDVLEVSGIVVDSEKNIYLTGYFAGTVDFNGVNKLSNGLSDIFLVKYDSSGNLVWSITAGQEYNDYGRGITIDENDNVYITGFFNDVINFKEVTKFSSGNNDIFIAKFSKYGSLRWLNTAGGNTNNVGWGIAIDINGNVYSTGYFTSTANFGGIFKTTIEMSMFIMQVDNP